MRLYTILMLVAIAIAVCCGVAAYQFADENRRLRSNQETLLTEVKFYRTSANESAASVGVLSLHVEELRRLRAEDCRTIRELGIRLRRAESYSKSAMVGLYASTLLLRDTIVRYDTVHIFSGSDRWSSVEGEIRGDTMHYTLRTVDTLHQVVHRIPRRFLFFRWGTKALRQEIVSSNPHTTLVYSEYIEIEK